MNSTHSSPDATPATRLSPLRVALFRIALVLAFSLALLMPLVLIGFLSAHREAGGTMDSFAVTPLAILGIITVALIWIAWRSYSALRGHRRALTGLPRTQRQFRHYFLLVDAATILALILAVLEFMPDLPLSTAPTGFVILIALTIIAATILMLIVVFGKSLRDEFAEQCWRAAAMSTIKILTAGPLILLVADSVLRALAREKLWMGGAGGILPGDDPGDALSAAWAVGVAVYLLSFQYHRWQASR